MYLLNIFPAIGIMNYERESSIDRMSKLGSGLCSEGNSRVCIVDFVITEKLWCLLAWKKAKQSMIFHVLETTRFELSSLSYLCDILHTQHRKTLCILNSTRYMKRIASTIYVIFVSRYSDILWHYIIRHTRSRRRVG